VATFVRSIRGAARDYLSDPLGDPMIPNWNRVEAALPDFLDSFDCAVQVDNK
jgi:glucosyl-3-phosphoglycerate synthase